MIRIEAVWLAVAPIDMRAGTDIAMARVVQVFGAAHPHHAYVFSNRRANPSTFHIPSQVCEGRVSLAPAVRA